MPTHIEIDEHGTRWVIDANGRRPADDGTPNVPPGSETNQQDHVDQRQIEPISLESILHKHWTASASGYQPPFDKQWWIAQQKVAIAIDRCALHMRTPDVDALVASWEWAASQVAPDAAPIVVNASDAQIADYTPVVGEITTAPDPRPVPPWCSLTREALDHLLATSDMEGTLWMAAARASRYALAWPIWERHSFALNRTDIHLNPRMDAAGHWRPQRLPGQREDGTIPASAMTPEHFERVKDWQWRVPGDDNWAHAQILMTWPVQPPGEEWRPAIWAELDAPQTEPDAGADLPADDPPATIKQPSPLEQIKNHAARAGYDFLESAGPGFEMRPWWRVRHGTQVLIAWGNDTAIRGRVGTAWREMSEAEALTFAESWPSTPNHMALEMVQEWASEPPEPEDSALEEHLAGQAERYVLHLTEQEALKVSRRTGKTPLPPRVIEALKALANIAVLIGLDDWDNPQAVVEAVRRSRQDRCGHATYAEHVTAYDKLMASHEALVEIASLLGIECGPQQVAAAVRERVGTWVDGPPTTPGDSWLALETETVVFFDVDELCYPGCKIIAHMPVTRPRYPR